MCTSTLLDAEAVPVQPVTVIDDDTVELSGIATSVPLVCVAHVDEPTVHVDEVIDRPVGRPVADHVYGAVPPDADSCRLAVPFSAVLWLPGLVTETPGTPPELVRSNRFAELAPGLVTLFGVADARIAACTSA